MGDADGRRGAAEGIVTVRATRQLTDRRTWGTGGELGGKLSDHAAYVHKRRQRQGSGTPAAYSGGPGLISPSDWIPANPTQASRGFLSNSSTQMRLLPSTRLPMCYLVINLPFEAAQSALLMTSLNKA